MSMILTLDIGNTNASIGIYDNDKLVETLRLSSDIKRTADEYGILLTSFFFLNSAFFRVKGLLLILLPFLLNLNHTWLWVPPMMSPESVPTHSSGTPPP